MNSILVVEQMLVICLLIFLGAILHIKGFLSDETTRQISALIVNVTNPAILMSSALEEEARIPAAQIWTALALSVATYLLAALAGFLIALLFRSDRGDRIAMTLLTMYGNVGFIGIPLALATLGTRAMVYVSVNNLVYCALFYSTGIPLLKRAAAARGAVPGEKSAEGAGSILHNLVNIGTMSALATILIYLFHPAVPSILSDTLLYAGRCTTFLSMLVLGVSVAEAKLLSILTNRRIWGFVLLRSLAMPVIVTLLLSRFIADELTLYAVALMLAVPAGNLPMIVSRKLGLDDSLFSSGIILSTLLSPLTITVVITLVERF